MKQVVTLILGCPNLIKLHFHQTKQLHPRLTPYLMIFIIICFFFSNDTSFNIYSLIYSPILTTGEEKYNGSSSLLVDIVSIMVQVHC